MFILQVIKQTSSVVDLAGLSESSEAASEDCEAQCPDYESIVREIEHLRMECKGK